MCVFGGNERAVVKYLPKAGYWLECDSPGHLRWRAVPGNSRNPKEDTLWSADFSLDDCLRQRAAGMTRIELEGVPFQLNPLLDLINEKFMVR